MVIERVVRFPSDRKLHRLHTVRPLVAHHDLGHIIRQTDRIVRMPVHQFQPHLIRFSGIQTVPAVPERLFPGRLAETGEPPEETGRPVAFDGKFMVYGRNAAIPRRTGKHAEIDRRPDGGQQERKSADPQHDFQLAAQFYPAEIRAEQLPADLVGIAELPDRLLYALFRRVPLPFQLGAFVLEVRAQLPRDLLLERPNRPSTVPTNVSQPLRSCHP